MDDLLEIQEDLKKRLSSKRFEHTLGVMYTATAMAMAHQADLTKARYAGLLHDCAKYLSDDKKMDMVKKYHLITTRVEIENKELLHGKIGAEFASDRYHVNDEEILSAIRCHTTGKPAMSLIEKILYIADYIEPNRKELPHMAEIRFLAFHDLDTCVLQILKNTIKYIGDKNRPLDETTLDTFHYYQTLCQKENENGTI